ncbi:MAG: YicC/YloC family endoribonuclease [Pirellulales bacterium]|nr:YicC family protein [Planctomycetales bacterium]
MLLSMTGYGEAHQTEGGLTVVAEVRAVNSRHFKLSVRAGERYSALEPRIEAVVRETIRRGTVQVSVRVTRLKAAEDYAINVTALSSYRDQLEKLHDRWHVPENVTVESLLMLPGVVDEQTTQPVDADADWPVIEAALRAAVAQVDQMRRDEGQAMEDDLRANCQAIAQELKAIESQAPKVAESYRDRLLERVNKLMAEFNVTVDAADIVREVSLFADRCDISEEVVRLASHLDQFGSIMGSPPDPDGNKSAGRKLEFLTQEMFRETNTIGSKANDVEIARGVIEIKTTIERLREMIQNVE